MKYTMSDSRVFTSFLPNCELNTILQTKYKTSDIHAFRYYLQHNAQQVMNDTRIGVSGCTKTCPVCEASLSYKPSGQI